MEQEQSEIMAFLAGPAAYPWPVREVRRLATHGAAVFLAGDMALKVKRAVSFPFMDFSTLDRRRDALRHELDINSPNAPDLYFRLLPITREADGALELGGNGTPVEWALQMRRFDQSDLLEQVCKRGPLAPTLTESLADAIAFAHDRAPIASGADGPSRLLRDAAQIEAAFAAHDHEPTASAALQLVDSIRHAIARHATLLAARGRDGLVRRCHGDLHLANIVLWHGRPTLFDAIEFNDAIATVDVLYDIAFLIMDLERAGQRAAANVLLARYLWRTRRPADLDALAIFPTMLALRAGIRAMVSLQRAGIEPQRADAARHDIQTYLEGARRFLAPPPPRLIAIGGLSGTGKSTLAGALAPLVGAAPGALHLRSDLERKALAGIEPTDRLPPEAYTPEQSRAVYARLADRTRRALAAGHTVVVDAVFAQPQERADVAALALKLSVPFRGLWLEAPAELAESRVAKREGDASDATPDVVRRQATFDTGPIEWIVLKTSNAPGEVRARAIDLLAIEDQS